MWEQATPESPAVQNLNVTRFLADKNAKLVEIGTRHASSGYGVGVKYANATGSWRAKVFPKNIGQLSSSVLECGATQLDWCPVFDDITAGMGEKNWYKSKRTPHQVAAGLRENARLLERIQAESGASMIVMYGSLIGQWWNRRSLPWDSDIDVHIVDVEKFERWLTSLPRMQFDKHEVVFGRENRLNVDHYDPGDGENFTIYFDRNEGHHIEYRLIHIPTGVYTDMMTFKLTNDSDVLSAKVQSRPRKLKVPAYVMKASFKKLWGGNIHNEEDIVPLSPCEFNGALLRCPRNVDAVLRQKFPNFDSEDWYLKNKKASFNTASNCWERLES